MHKRNFYFGQQPTYEEMNGTFNLVEARFQDALVEQGWYGIVANPWVFNGQFGIHPNSPSDMQVQCYGGVGYDKSGRRILRLTSAGDKIDLSSYKPTVAGDQRIVSIFVKHKRDEADERTDNNGNIVYWAQSDSHEFEIQAGAIANPGPPVDYPAVADDKLLLCDILFSDAMLQIAGYGTGVGQIDTTRKEYWWRVAERFAAKGLRAGEYIEAIHNLGVTIDTTNFHRAYNESFVRAWIRMSSAGAAIGKFNVASTLKPGPGDYNVILPAGMFSAVNEYVVIATLNEPIAGHIAATPFDATTILVNTFDGALNPSDRSFSLIVCGRPTITI